MIYIIGDDTGGNDQKYYVSYIIYEEGVDYTVEGNTIQRIAGGNLPYFEVEERLCTFKDPLRYKNYYIINAIKHGADKLNRADFVGKEAREAE